MHYVIFFLGDLWRALAALAVPDKALQWGWRPNLQEPPLHFNCRCAFETTELNTTSAVYPVSQNKRSAQ